MQYSNELSPLNIPNIDPYIKAPLFCIILIWLPVTSSSFRALTKQPLKERQSPDVDTEPGNCCPSSPFAVCSDPKLQWTCPLLSPHVSPIYHSLVPCSGHYGHWWPSHHGQGHCQERGHHFSHQWDRGGHCQAPQHPCGAGQQEVRARPAPGLRFPFFMTHSRSRVIPT